MTFVDHSLPFSEYLPDSTSTPRRVDLVIGGDLSWKYILSNKSLAWNDSGTIAIHELGKLWLSSGEYGNDDFSEELFSACGLLKSNAAIGSKVRCTPADRKSDMNKLETDPLYRSPSDDRLAMSRTDESVLGDYEKTVKLVEVDGTNHLQFHLRWMCDPSGLPNNYQQAKQALLGLQRKLHEKPELREQYCKKINAAIEEGHLVRTSDDELAADLKDANKLQYYIPHFNTAQSKFRVVYDAAREYQGVSLNNLLNRGPIFMQSLRSILIRFGERQYGVAGDNANMFFQIRIAPEDRDLLRILWFSDPDMKGGCSSTGFKIVKKICLLLDSNPLLQFI